MMRASHPRSARCARSAIRTARRRWIVAPLMSPRDGGEQPLRPCGCRQDLRIVGRRCQRVAEQPFGLARIALGRPSGVHGHRPGCPGSRGRSLLRSPWYRWGRSAASSPDRHLRHPARRSRGVTTWLFDGHRPIGGVGEPEWTDEALPALSRAGGLTVGRDRHGDRAGRPGRPPAWFGEDHLSYCPDEDVDELGYPRERRGALRGARHVRGWTRAA